VHAKLTINMQRHTHQSFTPLTPGAINIGGGGGVAYMSFEVSLAAND
jgi:hypothetical protein